MVTSQERHRLPAPMTDGAASWPSSRDDLAAAARVAPLLRAAARLATWIGSGRPITPQNTLTPLDAATAAAALDLSPEDVANAWLVATGSGMLVCTAARAVPGPRRDVLIRGDDQEVLDLWVDALRAVLAVERLDGLATALYGAGGPVRIDALFDASTTAGAADAVAGRHDGPEPRTQGAGRVDVAGLSAALEILADLGVVELGVDEQTTRLTVGLSPLGLWGVRERLSASGRSTPKVAGTVASRDAATILAALATCSADDGEAQIAAWLARRNPRQAAAELVAAASTGSPGLRGAAFAVLDRVGAEAMDAVRAALDDPVLRPHAAVWLRDHGEPVELSRQEREWLLVDLGAGLLEEAAPEDVVADLLPDLPPKARVDLVAGLWRVDHPAVVDLLVALSDHHPDPDVAKAARKAAFKARSRI